MILKAQKNPESQLRLQGLDAADTGAVPWLLSQG